MNYARAGAGEPPLVFIHGFLGQHRDWTDQTSYFSQKHDTVACDLRGHGNSPRGDAPMTIETLGCDVAALLDALDLKDVALVGHSMGCRVVIEAHRQAPSRVGRLVLIDGSRLGNDREAATKRFDAAIEAIGYRDFVSRLFEDMFVGNAPIWMKEIIESALAVSETIGLPLLRSIIAWDSDTLEAALAKLDIPVLVIQSTSLGADGKRCSLLPSETAPFQQLILDRVAHAESETLLGVGHFCMRENPSVTNAMIERFLGSKPDQMPER